MRNLTTHTPKSHEQMIGATVRAIFLQPDAESTRSQLRRDAGMLKVRYSKFAELLAEVWIVLAEQHDE